MSWPALFANFDDTWLKVIIAIVGIAIYVINHLASGLKKPPAGKPPRMPPVRPMVPPTQPQQPIPAQPVAQRRQELNAELSDFLRRAAQKRGESAMPPNSLPSTQMQSAPPPAPPAAPPKPPRKRRKSEADPSSTMRSEDTATKRRGLSSLDTSAIEGRGAQLSQLSQTDEVQDRVPETFNRQLGNITAAMDAAGSAQIVTPDQQVETTASAADGLFALLRDPQSLRGAIILNEIMTRPEQRW